MFPGLATEVGGFALCWLFRNTGVLFTFATAIAGALDEHPILSPLARYSLEH
jgi:hypothetical protein